MIMQCSINFLSLAFLVPYSTLINCLLKNIFQIPRPNFEIHLIPVLDPFGFPSGDVQVATVFLGYIFLRSTHWARFLIGPLIVGIGFSRIYLGVHSFIDVVFALIIGILIVLLWDRYLENLILKKHFLAYWVLVTITVLTFFLVSTNVDTPPMVGISLGVLISYGLLLPYLQNQEDNNVHIGHTLVYLLLVILAFKSIPIIKTSALLINISLVVKFMFVNTLILYVVPMLDKTLFQNRAQLDELAIGEDL